MCFAYLPHETLTICVWNWMTENPTRGVKIICKAVLFYFRFTLVVLKMLCLYHLGQNCLHFTFYPYLSSETYSRQYEKLPNIVIHACKILQKKMNLLKMCGPQSRLCLFMFRPIASKQSNSLTTIVTRSWLCGAEVTHPP